MDITEKEIKKRLKHDMFSKIAFWQFMGFTLFICYIWVNEIFNLPDLFFDSGDSRINIFRASSLTIITIIISLITVGNTYLQQRHIIKGLLMVCMKCGKIKINDDEWSSMDKYIMENTLAALSHGICPDCEKKINEEINSIKMKK